MTGLTLASGFIAAHILLRFLRAGHTVVATVRTNERAKQVLSAIPEDLKSRLTFAIVPDVAVPGCFDQVYISVANWALLTKDLHHGR